jgi:hypothetical protein
MVYTTRKDWLRRRAEERQLERPGAYLTGEEMEARINTERTGQHRFITDHCLWCRRRRTDQVLPCLPPLKDLGAAVEADVDVAKVSCPECDDASVTRRHGEES